MRHPPPRTARTIILAAALLAYALFFYRALLRSRVGLVVLTDTFYPGWTASVDGQPAPIVRANYFARGVYVDAGEHRVVFRYAPLKESEPLTPTLSPHKCGARETEEAHAQRSTPAAASDRLAP